MSRLNAIADMSGIEFNVRAGADTQIDEMSRRHCCNGQRIWFFAGSEAKFTFQIKHKVAIWPLYALFFNTRSSINPLDDGHSRAAHAPVGILPLLEPQRVLENVPADCIDGKEDSNECRCSTDIREVEWERDEWDVSALTKSKGRKRDEEEGDAPK
jgi:hypothetical protein